MGLTNFPGGISSFGIPVLPGLDRAYTGNVFFVCNASGYNGSDNNDGTRPDRPLSTLAKAITLATASNDDVIYVMKGHAETLGAAAAIACSKAGVSIIGLGNGRARPTFTWATLTSATWTISAANVTIKNCVFVGTGIDALVTMFAVTGDDCAFEGCEFDIANATNQVALGITITGTDRFRFVGNHVHGTADAGCANFIQCVGAASKQKDYLIAGNHVIGAFTTSLGFFNNITTAMVNAVFRDNVIVNLTASATKCIVCLTASTGLVMNNRFGIGSGAAPITMDAGWWAGNWSAAAVATNGTLV
jgi:hypothetical protein